MFDIMSQWELEFFLTLCESTLQQWPDTHTEWYMSIAGPGWPPVCWSEHILLQCVTHGNFVWNMIYKNIWNYDGLSFWYKLFVLHRTSALKGEWDDSVTENSEWHWGGVGGNGRQPLDQTVWHLVSSLSPLYLLSISSVSPLSPLYLLSVSALSPLSSLYLPSISSPSSLYLLSISPISQLCLL